MDGKESYLQVENTSGHFRVLDVVSKKPTAVLEGEVDDPITVGDDNRVKNASWAFRRPLAGLLIHFLWRISATPFLIIFALIRSFEFNTWVSIS